MTKKVVKNSLGARVTPAKLPLSPGKPKKGNVEI
jgi:hypothetical protein